MFASPVFDLAKLIATGMFVVGERTQFQSRMTADLLAGYESLKPLTDNDLLVLEGLMLLLNEETARLGDIYDDAVYRSHASAVADWWITRRKQSPQDPLGIRRNRQPPLLVRRRS